MINHKIFPAFPKRSDKQTCPKTSSMYPPANMAMAATNVHQTQQVYVICINLYLHAHVKYAVFWRCVRKIPI